MNGLRWRILGLLALLAIVQAAGIVLYFEPTGDVLPIILGCHIGLVFLTAVIVFVLTIPASPKILELEEMLRCISIGQTRNRLETGSFGPLSGLAEAANEIAAVLSDRDDPAIGAVRTRKRTEVIEAENRALGVATAEPKPLDRRQRTRKDTAVVALSEMSPEDAADSVMRSFTEKTQPKKPRLPAAMDDDGTTGDPKPLSAKSAPSQDPKPSLVDDVVANEIVPPTPEQQAPPETKSTPAKESVQYAAESPPLGFVQLPTAAPTPEVSEEHQRTDISGLMTDESADLNASGESPLATLESDSPSTSQLQTEVSGKASKKNRRKKKKKDRRRLKRETRERREAREAQQTLQLDTAVSALQTPAPMNAELATSEESNGDGLEQNLRELYSIFVDALSAEQLEIPPFDDFSEALTAQRAALIQQHSCKDVRFELSQVGGEVSFQPRLIR